MSDYEFWKELGTIFDAVLSYQRKNVEFNKRFISPWVQLGNVFDQSGSAAERIRGLRQAAEIAPRDAQNWSDLGDALYQAAQFDEAVEAYKKSIALDPLNGRTASNLALAFAAQGNYDEAIPLYRESIELLTEPNEKAVAWNRLGDAHRKAGDYGNAVLAFHKADQLNAEGEVPEAQAGQVVDPPTLAESAAVEENKKAAAESATPEAAGESQPEAAVSEETVSAGAESNLPAAEPEQVAEVADASTVELANVDAAGSGEAPAPSEPAQAAAASEAVASETPGAGQAASAYDEYLNDNLEPIRISAGEPDETRVEPEAQTETEAVAGLEGAAESGEQNAHIWNELANVYLNSGRYEEAIPAYIKAVRLDPNFGWAHSNLGMAYMFRGQNAEAAVHFQRSIEVFTDNKDKAVSWNRLGNLYRKQNDYDNAIAAYQMADELDPQSASLSLRSRFHLLGSLPEPVPV